MTTSLIEAQPLALPGPIALALEAAMEDLPTLWARLMVGTANGHGPLEAAVRVAEGLNQLAIAEVRLVGQLAGVQERSLFARMLVSAWPNASQNDLAGYGLQLSQDVEQQRPSRYALNEAGRRLRRTMRFLPSISEVLDELAAADRRMTDVLKTLDRIPVALAFARSELARA